MRVRPHWCGREWWSVQDYAIICGMRQPRNFATDRCCHLVDRTANGVRHTYEYDGRGQLLAVRNADGSDAERYAYDKAGNMVKKIVGGRTTTFTFDGANQLVSSTTDGVTTKYAYDAAGRLVKEGTKAYRYGYLDKVLSVTDGKSKFTYDYHVDGQLASANYGDSSEDFLWDGLALVKRGGERFINEPHIGGGNPVVSSKGTSYFNDMLGTTLGAKGKNRKYSAAALTAFGERLDNADTTSPAIRSLGEGWFTGKPYVEGLGHAFLMRNYRAGLAKWQTADPMGYPDGWNQLAYCGNGVVDSVDLWGCVDINLFSQGTTAHSLAADFNLQSYITVGGHGNSNGVDGASVEDLAGQIRAKDKFNSAQGVYLLACYVANGVYAQKLANLLRVNVCASDTLVWYERVSSNVVHVYAANEGYTFGGVRSGKRDIMDKKNHWVWFRPE